ncbi:hypothetical protein HZH66_007567 [Vespula vulgaris]|uniref:Uncharacterized protein n=1 Tax=Vespula vulgaris TaxID=7454 RepID=A0A834N4Q7_VESVU|nr:hypothetical protein HZH66_007567 [Vespula vulgaris]
MIGNARALRKSKPLASSSKRASIQSNFRIIKTTLDGELVVKCVCPGNEFGQVRISSFSPILIWPQTTTLTLFRVDPDSKEPLGFQFHLEESPSSLASIEMRDERNSTSALYAQGRSGSIFIILILDGQGQSLILLGSGASRQAIEFSSLLSLYRCDLRLRLVAVHDLVEDEREIVDALRKCSNETSRDNGINGAQSKSGTLYPRPPLIAGDMPFSVPLFVLKPRNHETFWLVATSSNSFRLS